LSLGVIFIILWFATNKKGEKRENNYTILETFNKYSFLLCLHFLLIRFSNQYKANPLLRAKAHKATKGKRGDSLRRCCSPGL